jgi:hypothetical protein
MPGERNKLSLVDLIEEARKNGKDTTVQRSELDPAEVAAINARARERYANHEAGHAVGVVARGGQLIDVCLGSVDCYPGADTLGGTRHQSAIADHPFLTYAGLWAQATWEVDYGDDAETLSEALENAWLDPIDGCANKYWDHVAVLDGVGAALGFSRIGIARAWEVEWDDELEDLLPAIHEVAELLIDGHHVTHGYVQAAVDMCRDGAESTDADQP